MGQKMKYFDAALRRGIPIRPPERS